MSISSSTKPELGAKALPHTRYQHSREALWNLLAEKREIVVLRPDFLASKRAQIDVLLPCNGPLDVFYFVYLHLYHAQMHSIGAGIIAHMA